MFGPREVLLTSDNPVITQFVNGRRIGPIGMSEEKDEATLAQERATLANGDAAEPGNPALMAQLVPSPGLPERQAVQRRMDRVIAMLPTLPTSAQQAILSEVGAADQPGAPAAPPALDATQPIDPERERAQAQARAEAWKLAREHEAAQRQAAWAATDQAAEEQEEREGREDQDKSRRWPPHWPGGGG